MKEQGNGSNTPQLAQDKLPGGPEVDAIEPVVVDTDRRLEVLHLEITAGKFFAQQLTLMPNGSKLVQTQGSLNSEH